MFINIFYSHFFSAARNTYVMNISRFFLCPIKIGISYGKLDTTKGIDFLYHHNKMDKENDIKLGKPFRDS